MSGAVLRVADGDTLTLRMPSGDNIITRLSDIDTPQVHHPTNSKKDDRDKDGKLVCPNAPSDEPGQPYGKAAGASLAQVAPVGAKASAECYEVDRYARHVCHVFIGASNLNLEQLRRGAAIVAANPTYVRDPESAVAEAAARSPGLGLWGTANPMNPDEWRSECWCGGRCEGAEK